MDSFMGKVKRLKKFGCIKFLYLLSRNWILCTIKTVKLFSDAKLVWNSRTVLLKLGNKAHYIISKNGTYPITTMVKSRKFHPFLRYDPGWATKPYAMIFIKHSVVNIIRKTYSIHSWKKLKDLCNICRVLVARVQFSLNLKRLKEKLFIVFFCMRN